MVSEPTLVGPKSMASANKLVRLKYSCEEVYERMEKGLCIFCEELDIPGHHQLKHKGIQVFMTECYGDQVSEDKEEAHLETVTNPNPSVETVTNLEPFVETMKHASVLQVPGSVSDVFLVHRVDSHVKEVEELPQESTNSNEKNVAHRVFDKMPLAVTSKEKQRKSLKAWKFKFKISFKRSKLMDDMFSFVEETAWRNRDPKEKIWDCVKKEFKETMAACGKKTIDRLKLVDETSKPAAYDRTFQIRVWDGGGSLLECVLWRRLKHYQRYGHEMQAIEAEMTIPLAKETQDWTVNALFKTQVFYDFDIASWIGLEIYFGCETKRHMLLRVKLANRVWERGELLATHAYCKWLESCYVRDRVLKYCFLLEMPFAEFIEIKACRKELSVAGLSQLSLASDGKSNEEAVTVLAARPQLFNTFLRICEYNKVDNPWVCNDRQKGAVCDAENKKLLNIEAGAKKGTNSCLGGKIAVALARKKGMVSKVGGSTFDLECDQIKFNNKEELVGLTEYSELRPSREYLLMNFGIFMNPQPPHDKRITLALLVGLVGQEKLSDRLSLANCVWKPGELLCVQDQWDWISEVHSGELQEWNDVVTGHFLFDMVEKGNYLDEVIEEVAKTFILTMIDEHKDIKTACVFLEMSLNRERLIQLDAPTVFSDLMCAMNRIRVRLKMVLLLEFLWLILFSSKMFKSSYVPQNKNQTNQKLSSYWKLLLRLLYPLHNSKWRSFYMLMIKPVFKEKEETVSFNIAVTSCNRFCFFPYSSWKISQNILVSSRCVLRQEESYVMVLFTIVANLILLSDAHILVARKKGTEIHTACCYGLPCGLDFNEEIKSDTFMDDFKSACKLLPGAFVLNLIAEQTRDWSFFGLLLQWKWHPPPQTTSEFHQAHNAKPCLSSLRTKMI